MIINLGNRVVNNYLISGRDGYILIDTGYSSGFHRFERKLKIAGIDPKQIKLVFLTHAHDDHAGFLNDVLALTDAKVILRLNPVMLYPAHGKPFLTSDLKKYLPSLDRVRLYPLKPNASKCE